MKGQEMRIWDLNTPALIVNKAVLQKNAAFMQGLADDNGVALRPHIKTHRTPALAQLQTRAGAQGITVAKIGEAEVMADNGMKDIFISNVIVGKNNFQRLKNLSSRLELSIGVDSIIQTRALADFFAGNKKPLDILIEVEVGERRTGVLPNEEVVALAREISKHSSLKLKGLYTHEGHSYGAKSISECQSIMRQAQLDILLASKLLQGSGIDVDTISIGSTPSLMHGQLLAGITEIRPGTYLLMDAAQGASLKDYSRCAAFILATVISKPNSSRVVLDAGVKALTAFVRPQGICHTPGYGKLADYQDIFIDRLYDEHAVIENESFNRIVNIGDKVRIIPNHICPTCNLYDKMFLYENNNVTKELLILCRGKSQ